MEKNDQVMKSRETQKLEQYKSCLYCSYCIVLLFCIAALVKVINKIVVYF